MRVKVWPVIFFDSANISQAHSEIWKVCLSLATMRLIIALAVQGRIIAVRRSFLFLFLFLWGFIFIAIIGQGKFVKLSTHRHNRAVQRFEGRAFVIAIALSIAIRTSALYIYNMATLQSLETQGILLIWGQSMIFMLLKETVINGSVGDVWDSGRTSLSMWVLVPRAKLTSETFNCGFSAFISLM
jgi:hypothetical protein